MRFQALATDYDGTLASGGLVLPGTLEALSRLRRSGRRLVLVTGRVLHELREVFPALDACCDAVVAENGALLYLPATGEERLLGDPPPLELATRLAREGVEPLVVGRAILATVVPHDAAVLRAIRELGLELEVVFNRGAVMVLPAGVTKATGLAHALAELGLSPHNAVAIGDAENDHHLLGAAECGVAVANALPALRARADLVTPSPASVGVQELIGWLVADDLRRADLALARHAVLLGHSEAGLEVRLEPARGGLLVAGPPGPASAGAAAFAERCAEAGYQVCAIDPLGELAAHDRAVRLGSSSRPPEPTEVLRALARPEAQVVVSLEGIAPGHLAGYGAALLPRLADLRARTGRPHRLVLGEAHAFLPALLAPDQELATALPPLVLLSDEPEALAPAALANVESVLALGSEALSRAARALRRARPAHGEAAPGSAWLWRRGESEALAVLLGPARGSEAHAGL